MHGHDIPFRPEFEICKTLVIEGAELHSTRGKCYLPGQPGIAFDEREVIPFLEKDLLTPLLEQMSPWLWLVATPKSTHVSALHAQNVRGRNITITEDPELHLVWINNKVFIKPLPTYLLSYAFWAHYLLPDRKLDAKDSERRLKLLQVSLGYIRTYLHLIQHESDFRIAKREYLVPEDLDFETWVAFSREFKYIEDRQVSGRYGYGDLRLTRLNFWVKPILRRHYFRKAAWQYADHFAHYIGPLLFVFTTWSVILGSMQVGLQSRPQWNRFADVSTWFSVVTLVSTVAILVFLLCAISILAGREVIYAFHKQVQKSWRGRIRKSSAHKPDSVVSD